MRTNHRATAIILKDQKILLVHRFKNGQEYWVLPGGGVESEETPEGALLREVQEETGLPVLKYKFLETKFDPSINVDQHYFLCLVGEGIPQLIGPEIATASSDNVYQLEWVDIDLLSSLTLYPDYTKSFDLKTLSID